LAVSPCRTQIEPIRSSNEI